MHAITRWVRCVGFASLAIMVVIACLASETPATAQVKKKKVVPVPTGPFNPKINKENFDKIQTGMEYKEVAAILGGHASGSSSGNKASYHWPLRHNDPQSITVDFLDGKVSGKSTTLKDDGLQTGLTRENYLRIRKGMSQFEAERFLGKPSKTSGGKFDPILEWQQEKISVVLRLSRTGLVVEKKNNQGWPNDEATVVAEQEAAWKAKFDQLKAGLTEEEAIKILGQPTKTDRASAGRAMMLWEQPERFALAVLQDGKIVRTDASILPPADNDITRAFFERARIGMTRDAAVAMLGTPTEDNNATLIWRQEGKFVILNFKDGKVSERRSSEAQAPYVVFEKTDRDRIDDALANLRSFDPKSRRSALEFFSEAPFDEELAKDVSRLAQNALQDKDPFVRSGAARVLRQWATTENADYFLRILNSPLTKKVDDPNREKFPLAIDVMVKLRDPRAAEPLCKHLYSFFDRSDAAKALAKFGPEIVPQLTKHINAKDFFVRKTCEDLLKELKADGNVLLDRCLVDLNNPDPERRGAAIGRIMTLPVNKKRQEEVAALLQDHLADKSFYTATMSASLLGTWGSEKNEAALLGVLKKTPSRDMKAIVCKSLGKIGTQESLAALEPLTRDFETSLARSAQDAIQAIRNRKKE